MQLQPDHALQWVNSQQLPDPAQPVVDAAAVQVQFRGNVLDGAVVVARDVSLDRTLDLDHARAEVGEVVAVVSLLAEEGLRALARCLPAIMRGGKPQVLDGPYAESREQIGGYYLIEAPDHDAAMAWAARCPVMAISATSSC